MLNKLILVVEDNEMTAKLICMVLARQVPEERIQVVHDGMEALEYLRGDGTFAGRAPGQPTVILLDNNMPRMSGLEFLEATSHDERLKHVPVVMFTSSDEAQDRRAAYERGVNAYVVKPIGFEELTKAIGTIVAFWADQNRRVDDPSH